MNRILATVLCVLLAACGPGPDDTPRPAGTPADVPAARVRGLLERADQPAALAELVRLRPVPALLEATRSGPNAGPACLALGAIGGPAARERLAGVLADRTRATRELRLWARHAFRLLADPGALMAAHRAVRRRLEREREAAAYLPMMANPDARRRVVELGGLWTLLDATSRERPAAACHQASIGLGRIKGPKARDRLLALLEESSGDPLADGPRHLYAAVGLTLLGDPGTAIDLLLNLSRINPNDYLAARAGEGETGPYWTIDAQLCDALLGLGLWDVEEELLEQLGRRCYVRVLIDAHAVLRRRTGLKLPLRYNGSYAARETDVAAWRRALRATRAERYATHPFEAGDPRFQERCATMMAWLRGQSVNNRYIAQKVVERLGPYATPWLLRELASGHRVAQRQAALLMGRIGDRAACRGLRAALDLEDADARAEVVRALARLRDAKARAAVRARLADPDAEVRAAAADYLGTLGALEDRPALRAALGRERAPGTETALLRALLRLGDRSVIARLAEISRSGGEQERRMAAEALADAGRTER